MNGTPCRAAILIGLAFACAANARPAGAQVLRVHVVDEDGAGVPGATVAILQGDRRGPIAVTDQLGHATHSPLPPGTYSLRLEALGYQSRTLHGVLISAGEPRLLEVRLQPLPVALDGIAVRSTRIAIQRENTDFSTIVGEDAIALMPLPHAVSEVVALTPGARAEHVWGGASFQANSYRLDGLPANHPGLGGAIVEPSLTWVDRVVVRGLGAGAEHGGFQGGQVQVVTKRGTNRFEGMLRSNLEHHAMAGTNLVSTEIGSEVDRRYDVEGEIRGPIVPDRLWYYLAGSYVDQDSRVLRHMPGEYGEFGSTLEERSDRKAFGKLTWARVPGEELELSGGFLGTTAEHHGMIGYEEPDASSTYSSPTWFGNASWQRAIGNRILLEARANHVRRDERQDPYNGIGQPGVRLFSIIPPYTSFHNAAFSYRTAPATTAAGLTGTFRVELGGQEHLIKLGGEYSLGSFRERRTRNGGMTWMPIRSARFDPLEPATWSGDIEGYTPTEWGGEVHLDADVVNGAAFLQTAFSLGRLVLSPGIRWGWWEGWLTPRYGAGFRAVHDNGFDPRLGTTLELTEDRSMVLKAHWGRYHQNMITQMFDRAAGSDAFTNQEIWNYHGPALGSPSLGFTLAQRDSLAELGLFTRESVISLNETGPVHDYRQPFVDQWLIGFEKQFGSTVKLEALYVRRTNRDMIALVDRNRDSNYTRFERVTVHMAGPDGPPLPYGGWYVAMRELYVPNYAVLAYLRDCAAMGDTCDPLGELTLADTLNLSWNPDYVLTNAPGARREFGQLQVSLEIARPTWGASLSLAATSLEGNLDNVSGYVDPTEYGPGPYVRVNEGTNAWGPLPNFSDREAKASVWGLLPWDIRGGLFWTYRSGDRYAARFEISSNRKYYGYRTNGHAASAECVWAGSNCTPGQWGEPLPYEFLEPLDGHRVYIGPRGTLKMNKRSNLDARLERMFDFDEFDLGVSLHVFNIFGIKEVTEIQEMVNHGQNFNYFSKDVSDPSLWAFPPNNYFEAPLDRVRPRRLRLGTTVYF